MSLLSHLYALLGFLNNRVRAPEGQPVKGARMLGDSLEAMFAKCQGDT